MRQAEDLKRQQRRAVKREQLRVQEDALRQQIEAYDNLIVTKKAELEDAVQVLTFDHSCVMYT